jgi:hypothetical protein
MNPVSHPTDKPVRVQRGWPKILNRIPEPNQGGNPMTEQNQNPDPTADDATGHARRGDEDDTQGRGVHRDDDDAQGHVRLRADDEDDDDTEGHARRI